MSKLNGLKEKLAGLQSQLLEKADKIAFIRKWREKRAAAAQAAGAAGSAARPKDDISLGKIYREGSTLTRAQVIVVFIFAAIAIVSAGSLAQKVLLKFKSSQEHEKMVAEVTEGFADLKRKSEEKAELLSLGRFNANAFVAPKQESRMQVDLWIRVNNPEAAALVNDREAIFHDRVMDALNEIYVGRISLLTDQGKAKAKASLVVHLNKAMPEGRRVEEVFIENLIMQ